MKEITPEIVKGDVEKMMGQFETLGKGSGLDRAAQMVIQTMQVVRGRLENLVILKMLYIDNEGAGKLLPEVVLETVQGLCSGKINRSQAEEIIDSALPKYKEAFINLGLNPERAEVLFSKSSIETPAM